MKQRFSISVDGRTHEVEVEPREDGKLWVQVAGKAFLVSREENGAPLALPTPAPASLPVLPPRPARSAGLLSGNVLTAPMPGVILDIAVQAGTQVTQGQQLCALEAMKMKNAIRSPREGRIAAVEVTEGQKVGHGEVLFRYE